MANRIVVTLPIFAIAVGLGSCSEMETPVQCIERLAAQFPDQDRFDSWSWRSTLTYRLAERFTIPELQRAAATSDAGEEGPTFTFAMGSEQAAFDNFTKQHVPANGAYLIADGVTCFRIRGPVGSLKDAAAMGCASGPEGSRLIQIDWASDPGEATDGTRSST